MLTQQDFQGARPGGRRLLVFLLLWLLLLAACATDVTPTPVGLVPEVEATGVVAEAATDPPPTDTVEPTVAETATSLPTEPPPATSTPIPTATPVTPTATDTAEPTATDTAEPTATAVPPTATAVPPTEPPPPAAAQPTAPPPPAPTEPPPAPAEPVSGVNILPNSSFEEGWYHMYGAPELQLPNGWTFGWEEGPTGFGGQEWDVWVRPETRVLPYYQLPEHERSLFVRQGDYTIKMFKGNGAISFWLFRDLALEAGAYVFEINVFPDLVSDYDHGQKIWAGDPISGEVRFILGGGGSDWILPAFGQWNTLNYTFTLSEPQTIRLGAAFRGRYALANNGWFFDEWSLKRVQN